MKYIFFYMFIIIILFLIIIFLYNKYYNISFYSLIINNSHSFPNLLDIGLDDQFNFISHNKNKALFIQGGTKFGSRYPDIIINKYDVIRALNIIRNEFSEDDNTLMLKTPTYLNKIVFLIRKILHTDESIVFDLVNGLPDPTR